MPAQAFCTNSGRYYVYDALTNRIISIKKYKPCETEVETERQLLRDLQERGIFSSEAFPEIHWRRSFEEYLEKMTHGVPRLMLQLTRRCNLNCRYCVYSGNYGNMLPHADEDMDRETIVKALDLFAKVSEGCRDVSVSMYGGEVLLRLDLMKFTVDYANEALQGRSIAFQITSNGLLLNENVGRWLRSNPTVILTVTLNGPYHDRHRVTPSGEGSLAIIMKNLQGIRQNYPDVWEKQIRFISNISHSSQLSPLKDFFEKEIGKAPVSITHIRAQYGNETIEEILSEQETEDLFPLLQEEYRDKHDPFLDAYFRSGIRALHTRPILADERDAGVGSCFPLVDRIFIHSNGNLGICESACDKVVVGDLETGPDLSVLRKIYEGTETLFQNTCRNCWAQRLCTICLKDVFSENGELVGGISEEFCKISREHTLAQLKMYCEIAERNPERLKVYE